MRVKLLSILISLAMLTSMLCSFSAIAYADEATLDNPVVCDDASDIDAPAEISEEESKDWDWDDPDEPDVAPITDIKVKNIKYNSAKIVWTKPGEIDGYDVYREIWTYDDGWYTADYEFVETIDNPDVCEYQLTKLLSWEYYCFYVVPYKYVDGEKESAYMFDCECADFQTAWCMTGSFYTSNKKLAKSLVKVFKGYKENAKFKGAGECYGYAEWGSKKIAKTRKKVTINKKVTLSNVNKYIVGLKAGAHVRFYSKRVSHSVLIFKATKSRIYWADNNWGHNNRVHYHAGTPTDFYAQYSGYTKIQWIMKTKTYR